MPAVFDMPPESAGFDIRAGWLVRRLATDRPALRPNLIHPSAIVGNIGGESGLTAIPEKHPVIPGSRGGFGWCQWTGPRRKAYESFCAARGYDVHDDQANYEFLLLELDGSENHAFRQLLKTTDLRAATDTFMRLFERPGDPEGTLPERLKFAQKALVAANNNPSPAPVPDIPPVKQTKRDPIKLGDRGTLVQIIQLALGGVKSDAIYGRNTQAAVAAFQKQKRIEPTGIVDKTTWGKLFAWPKTPKNKEEKT
jgi:hypothetical protein